MKLNTTVYLSVLSLNAIKSGLEKLQIRKFSGSVSGIYKAQNL